MASDDGRGFFTSVSDFFSLVLSKSPTADRAPSLAFSVWIRNMLITNPAYYFFKIYLDYFHRGGGFPGLDILQRLAVKALDPVEDALYRPLGLNLVAAGQHDLLHSLGGLQALAVKASNA